MKHLLALSLLALLLAACAPQSPTPAPTTGDFAIYLLAENGPATLLDAAPLEEIALAETPIIAPADLLAYDTATHTMTVSEEAIARVRDLFALPAPVGGIPFVVTAVGERIYAGAFWTPLSSLSYDGVTILDPLTLSSVQPGDLRITLGYPTQEAFTGEDPRSDPRILEAVAGR